MNLTELQSRLHDLGADIPQNTLKRWGYNGFIPRPKRIKKGKGKGKGRAVSWSSWAAVEAGAIWAVKNAGILKGSLSKQMIDCIRLAEYNVYNYPPAKYSPSNVAGTKITAKSVKVKFVSDEFPYIDPFPGRAPADKTEVLNSLVVVWICAIEKARIGMSLRKPARVIMHWKPKPASERTEGEDSPYDLDDINVDDTADHDEIIEYVNGIDMRELAAQFFISNPTSTRSEKKTRA